MRLIPIQVETDPGAAEVKAPRRFSWEGTWLEVVEITDRWHEPGGKPEWPAADYFKVFASDGHEYLLKHDRECDEWFFGRRW